MNFDLIEDVLRLLLIEKTEHGLTAPEGADVSEGSILVFLPGVAEITTLADRLRGSRLFGKTCFEIIPLHSNLSSQDQRKAFRRPEVGKRKIIISTNVAETSGKIRLRR